MNEQENEENFEQPSLQWQAHTGYEEIVTASAIRPLEPQQTQSESLSVDDKFLMMIQQMRLDHEQMRQERGAMEYRFENLLKSHSKERPPALPPIHSLINIELNLRQFEEHMTTYGINKSKWPAELRAILRDEALQAFLATPRGESYDYEEVKKAILTRAGVSTTARVQQTFSFTPSTTRTASQVFADIKDTWTDFSRGMKTIEEFIEALSLECVFKMTAPHIQAAVRQLHCKDVRKAVEEIDNYVIHRELATNKIWKRNYPLQSQWHNNR